MSWKHLRARVASKPLSPGAVAEPHAPRDARAPVRAFVGRRETSTLKRLCAVHAVVPPFLSELSYFFPKSSPLASSSVARSCASRFVNADSTLAWTAPL